MLSIDANTIYLQIEPLFHQSDINGLRARRAKFRAAMAGDKQSKYDITWESTNS